MSGPRIYCHVLFQVRLQSAEEGQEATSCLPIEDMDTPKHQQLLSETREHIAHLEDAIAQINAVRKGLKENAIEVSLLST